METFSQVELWVGRLAAVVILCAFGIILVGIFDGIKRLRGEETDQRSDLRIKPLFYILSSAVFAAFCWWIWKPLPINFSLNSRIIGLVIGTPLLLCGIALIIWGRLTLGRHYFVSTSQRAVLFADQVLISTGPFAIVRHPMYLGILLVGLGGTLLYRTWTMVFIIVMYLGLRLRARREEKAFAAAFGEQWQQYILSVPPWLPRLQKRPWEKQ